MNHTEYQAHLAEVLELPCGIASISPNARITWRKDEKELLNVKDRLYNHSLILHVSAEDAGNYFCQVDDESIGQLTSMMSLKVHGNNVFFLVDESSTRVRSSSDRMSHENEAERDRCRCND